MLIRKGNPDFMVPEEPRFTTRDGFRLKPAWVVESGDQVLEIDLAIVWDANEGVLKHKASEKGATTRFCVISSILRRHSRRVAWYSVRGVWFIVKLWSWGLPWSLGFTIWHTLAHRF